MPRSTVAGVGASSPASSRSSVVLPEPLTPTSADAVAGAEPPRDAAQQRLVAEARRRDVDGVEDLVAEARRREAQQLRAVAHLGLVGDQRVRRVDAELRLGRARGRAAAQPGELLAQELLAAVLARGGLAVALGAGEHVRRVATLVLVDGRRRRPPTSPCTPRRGTSGRGSRRASSRGARRDGARASRRPRRRGGWSARRAAAARGRPAAAARARCAAARRRTGRRSACPCPCGKRASATPPSRPSSTARNARRRPTRGRRGRRRARRGSCAARRARRPGRASPAASVARAGDRAGVGLLDAGDQAQQRRLAVAVAPDDADPLARVDPERDVAQHRPAAVALADGLEVDEVAGRRRHRPPHVSETQAGSSADPTAGSWTRSTNRPIPASPVSSAAWRPSPAGQPSRLVP